MSVQDAAWTLLVLLAGFGVMAGVCGLVYQWAAWIWYRADGGRLGFWAFLRGF